MIPSGEALMAPAYDRPPTRLLRRASGDPGSLPGGRDHLRGEPGPHHGRTGPREVDGVVVERDAVDLGPVAAIPAEGLPEVDDRPAVTVLRPVGDGLVDPVDVVRVRGRLGEEPEAGVQACRLDVTAGHGHD